MTKKKTLYESEARHDRAAVAAFLRLLADQIDAGKLALGEGDGLRQVELPSNLAMEVSLERVKRPKKRSRYDLEIELGWRAKRKKRGKEQKLERETEKEEGGGEAAALLAPVKESPKLANPERVLLEPPDEEE